MRGLTFYQPWAGAITCKLKRFDTRSWRTPYRGRLLIHAARRWTSQQECFCAHAAFLLEGEPDVTPARHRAFLEDSSVFGAVVAVADLVECWPTDGTPIRCGTGWLDVLPDTERLFGDFTGGRYAWQLDDVTPLREPIPCAGMRGLWTPPPDIIEAVGAMLGPAAERDLA